MGSPATRRAKSQSNEVARPFATVYTLNLHEHYIDQITVELTFHDRENPANDKWAVRKRIGRCLNNKGGWEYEPMPSSRKDNFLARTRFSLDEAIQKGLDYLRNR